MDIVASIDFEGYKAVLAALRTRGTIHSKMPKRRYSALGISLLIFISFVLAYAAHDNIEKPALVILGIVSVYVVYLASMWWSKSRYHACLKEIYKAQEKQLCGQPMSITEEGISGKSSDQTYSYHYQWAAFVRLIDLPDGLLFLPNVVSFVRVPKATLSNEDIRQIMSWWAPYAERAQ